MHRRRLRGGLLMCGAFQQRRTVCGAGLQHVFAERPFVLRHNTLPQGPYREPPPPPDDPPPDPEFWLPPPPEGAPPPSASARRHAHAEQSRPRQGLHFHPAQVVNLFRGAAARQGLAHDDRRRCPRRVVLRRGLHARQPDLGDLRRHVFCDIHRPVLGRNVIEDPVELVLSRRIQLVRVFDEVIVLQRRGRDPAALRLQVDDLTDVGFVHAVVGIRPIVRVVVLMVPVLGLADRPRIGWPQLAVMFHLPRTRRILRAPGPPLLRILDGLLRPGCHSTKALGPPATSMPSAAILAGRSSRVPPQWPKLLPRHMCPPRRNGVAAAECGDNSSLRVIDRNRHRS